MHSTETPGAMPHVRSDGTECCSESDCGPGLRNNYFPGKRLTPDTYRVEQRYLVERRRLLNRAMHGWGVVYGYSIALDPPPGTESATSTRKLKIGAGLALDTCGRELVQLGVKEIAFEDLIFLDHHGRPADFKKAVEEAEKLGHERAPRICWKLSVHYAEQDRNAVRINDPCSCEQREWDQVCETVRYTLQLVPCKECCDRHVCKLKCTCASGPCCHPEVAPEHRDVSAELRWRAERPSERGGCSCLCDHLTGLPIDGECDHRLCELEEPCGRVRVDLEHGVPLACLEMVKDERQRTIRLLLDACGPRRLVKRNDLLFDLISGCDLTHITRFGWERWHRQRDAVPFKDFDAALGYDASKPRRHVATDFWVEFSGPVRGETVREDCFAITILSREEEGGWWRSLRVPIIDVVTKSASGDPPGHVRHATIVVDGRWIDDAVRGSYTVFQRAETRIEIEVRGDFILDCNGQAVDANAIGLSTARTGNGSPGDSFMSGFLVARARDDRDRTDHNENTDRTQGVTS